MLIARERLGQAPVLFLGKRAQEFDVVRGRAIVRECQKNARISLLERLMEKKRSFFISAPAERVLRGVQKANRSGMPFFTMLSRDPPAIAVAAQPAARRPVRRGLCFPCGCCNETGCVACFYTLGNEHGSMDRKIAGPAV